MAIAQLIPPSNWQILNGGDLAKFISEEFDVSRNILSAAKPSFPSNAFAVLEYRPVGYVDVSAKANIDSNAVAAQIKEDLQILSNEMQLSAQEALRWQGFVLQPQFRMQEKTLDYGIAVYFGQDLAINFYRTVLAKNGVVVLTIVCSDKDAVQLNASWKIQIASEMNYQNYRPGVDMKAEGNLDNVVLMNEIM